MPSGDRINFNNFCKVDILISAGNIKTVAMQNLVKLLARQNIKSNLLYPSSFDSVLNQTQNLLLVNKNINNTKKSLILIVDDFDTNLSQTQIVKQIENLKLDQNIENNTPKNNTQIAYFFNTQMQCMLRGVCSKCVVFTKNEQIYTCKNNFIFI